MPQFLFPSQRFLGLLAAGFLLTVLVATAAADDAPNLVAGKFGKGLDASAGGLSVLNGKDDARRAPITVASGANLIFNDNGNANISSTITGGGNLTFLG